LGWIELRLVGNGSEIFVFNGVGWVVSVIWWVALSWVDENRPADNSEASPPQIYHGRRGTVMGTLRRRNV